MLEMMLDVWIVSEFGWISMIFRAKDFEFINKDYG